MTFIVSIVLGVLAIVAGILEFIDRMGFPTPLEQKRQLRNKKIILDTLSEIGVIEEKHDYLNITRKNRLRKRKQIGYPNSLMDELIIKYTNDIGSIDVGLTKKTKLKYYINFMDLISNDNELKIIVSNMARFIIKMNSDKTDKMCFTKIATPKYTNPGFALLLSIELNVPCVFIDNKSNPLSSSTVDGFLGKDDIIILVQDVLTTGHTMLACINELNKLGYEVYDVFVVIERTDCQSNNLKTPTEYLNIHDINLHSIYKLNDSKLHKMLKS